jgi:mono/diheme cytochrome c family protein
MKIIKWILYILGGLIVAIALGVLSIYLVTENHRTYEYEVEVTMADVIMTPESVENGRHVATIRGCVDCHGSNLGGDLFIEDPVVGLFVASNLTSGAGGIANDYSDADFIRAIRHGVRKDRRSVIYMPSHEYSEIDSKDMNDLIAYIRSLEPVDNELPQSRINLPFRLMYFFNRDIHLFPARIIDHSRPIPEPVMNRTPIQLGEYVGATCTGCHGAGFSGGRIPGSPPDWPAATNLTRGGPLADWDEYEFITTMRTGITPDGRELQNQYMPWQVFGQMTDEELQGLFAYLKSLPPAETGNR